MIKRVIKAFSSRIRRSYYKAGIHRNRQIRSYLEQHPVAKLQIGCGPSRLPDWLNTDVSLSECKKGAVYMDAGEFFPLPDSSVDYIYSEHVFEHLTYSDAVNMLRECHRVLKPRGVIRISTPDLRFLVDLYQNPFDPLNERFIKWSANGGAGGAIIPAAPAYVISKFHTTWGHKIIYDYDTLAALLQQFGFNDICQCELSQSKHAALQDVERHHLVYSAELYKLQTMILEATKTNPSF